MGVETATGGGARITASSSSMGLVTSTVTGALAALVADRVARACVRVFFPKGGSDSSSGAEEKRRQWRMVPAVGAVDGQPLEFEFELTLSSAQLDSELFGPCGVFLDSSTPSFASEIGGPAAGEKFARSNRVVVVRDFETCERLCAEMLARTSAGKLKNPGDEDDDSGEGDHELDRVIGLDCEWTPVNLLTDSDPRSSIESESLQKNGDVGTPSDCHVDLVQLCDRETTLLVPMHRVKREDDSSISDGKQELQDDLSTDPSPRTNPQRLYPPSFLRLLNDGRILKTGAAVAGDAQRLLRGHGIDLRGTVDLQPLAHRLSRAENGCGLASITFETLGIKLDKVAAIRCGNWRSDALSEDQILYAALDAWASRAAFVALFRDHGSPGLKLELFAQGCVDLTKPIKSKNFGGGPASSPARRKGVYEYVRAAPMYDNCVMQDPDGNVMCICNEKKIDWYLSRELAEELETPEGQPRAIRLLFAPNGPGHGGDKFHLLPKTNSCVVCGVEPGDGTGVVRHAVIPNSFRRHFPSHLMARTNHHDVVALCPPCSIRCTAADDAHRRVLQEKFGRYARGGLPHVERDTIAAGKLARAIIEKGNQFPPARIGELSWRIVESIRASNEDGRWGEIIAQVEAAAEGLERPEQEDGDPDQGNMEPGEHPRLNDELLQEISNFGSEARYRTSTDPSQRWEGVVVRKIVEEAMSAAEERGGTEEEIEDARDEAILKFCRDWRVHFVAAMQPQHLHDGWSITYRPRADAT